MEVWFRVSLLFTIICWLAVVVGLVAAYYTSMPMGSEVFVCAAPLALISSVTTFVEWRCSSVDP
jgi:hypothetical protein